MSLVIQRVAQNRRSTTGQYLIDGALSYVTLEPPPEPNPAPDGNGYVCIRAGVYPYKIRWSNRFSRLVPHVEEVPGRTAIEHHIGNYPLNTDGCGLIGKDYGQPVQPDFVSQSAASFAKLMATLFARATLTNPDSPERDQVWDVGTITYLDIAA